MLFWILEIIWRKSLLASWRKGVKLGHAGAGGVVGGDSGYCVITLLFFDWGRTDFRYEPESETNSLEGPVSEYGQQSTVSRSKY
jgi:hypothetical protein